MAGFFFCVCDEKIIVKLLNLYHIAGGTPKIADGKSVCCQKNFIPGYMIHFFDFLAERELIWDGLEVLFRENGP